MNIAIKNYIQIQAYFYGQNKKKYCVIIADVKVQYNIVVNVLLIIAIQSDMLYYPHFSEAIVIVW